MTIRDETGQFRAFTDADYECFTWFERDRKQVGLRTPNGREVFCLNDGEVDEAVEDGFLTTPRVPRPTDSDWHSHAVAYARERGLIK